MYFHKSPSIFKRIYPNKIWDSDVLKKRIYLTFDDGPNPEITPWVLEQLKAFNIKATFFCVGKNIEANPGIFGQILREGHQVGNHTFGHESGWESSNFKYYRSILKTEKLTKSLLFRPPYGKISMHKQRVLKNHGFEVILWDVLPGDFDENISAENCLEAAVTNTEKNSIVVFHDNSKSKEKLKYVLPKFLAHFTALGFEFSAIESKEMAA